LTLGDIFRLAIEGWKILITDAIDTLKNIFGLFIIAMWLITKDIKKAWDSMVEWFVNFDPYWLVNWWKDVWKKVTDWSATAATDMQNWATDIVNRIVGLGGLGDLYPRLDEFLEGLFSSDHGKIAGWLASAVMTFHEGAVEMVRGMIVGLLESGAELDNAVRNLIRRALGMAEQESDTHSESKAFYDLGANWMKGLASGISDNANIVEKALSSSLSTMIAPAARSSLSSFTSPTVNGSGSYSNVVNNNRNINISVTPTYAGVSSPATIYHDVSAAIASIRM
jgi:hypothetical protein